MNDTSAQYSNKSSTLGEHISLKKELFLKNSRTIAAKCVGSVTFARQAWKKRTGSLSFLRILEQPAHTQKNSCKMDRPRIFCSSGNHQRFRGVIEGGRMRISSRSICDCRTHRVFLAWDCFIAVVTHVRSGVPGNEKAARYTYPVRSGGARRVRFPLLESASRSRVRASCSPQ